MAEKTFKGWSRRDFVKTVGAGALAAGITVTPRPARAQKKTLKIAQWSHVVPDYDEYKLLGDVLDWATNVGYPGYASAGIDEACKTWVLPTMFAKVARGDETPENAVAIAEKEYKRIFARWK